MIFKMAVDVGGILYLREHQHGSVRCNICDLNNSKFCKDHAESKGKEAICIVGTGDQSGYFKRQD